MGFLEKIEPYLEEKDSVIQDFIVYALQDFPDVPEDWTVRLIKEALKSKDKEISILTKIHKHRLNEEAIKLLIEGAKHADKDRRRLYINLLHSISPEKAVKFRQELAFYLEKPSWSFYETLQKGGEEDVREQYGELLAQLESEKNFNQQVFNQAKMTVEVLIEKGWISDIEIATVLNDELNNDYFSYAGILIIHVIGIMGLTKYIPLIAGLLLSDDDLLQEVVSDTLIGFQSNQVVEAVVPYLKNDECLVYGTNILGNIKTPEAEAELVRLFPTIEFAEEKALAVEGICLQLSGNNYPEIDAYLTEGGSSLLVDLEIIAYGSYKIMGKNHSNLESWKEKALKIREQVPKALSGEQFEVTHAQIKVERNDPCSCGSGKKYKKCCGA